jgi:hypothetical protein
MLFRSRVFHGVKSTKLEEIDVLIFVTFVRFVVRSHLLIDSATYGFEPILTLYASFVVEVVENVRRVGSLWLECGRNVLMSVVFG